MLKKRKKLKRPKNQQLTTSAKAPFDDSESPPSSLSFLCLRECLEFLGEPDFESFAFFDCLDFFDSFDRTFLVVVVSSVFAFVFFPTCVFGGLGIVVGFLAAAATRVASFK